MRFDSKAYDKLYPRKVSTKPKIESMVETFTPSDNSADEPVTEVDDGGDGSDSAGGD